MNKKFWVEMSRLWCVEIDTNNKDEIANIALKDAVTDLNSKSSYSRNPLDDWGDEDDDF